MKDIYGNMFSVPRRHVIVVEEFFKEYIENWENLTRFLNANVKIKLKETYGMKTVFLGDIVSKYGIGYYPGTK